MSILMRISLALILVTLLAGCASYRTAILPSDIPVEDVAPDLETVRTGSRARVTLDSGEIIDGEVMRVDSQTVVLGKPGNYGLSERLILAQEIQSIEVQKNSKLSGIIASTAGLAVMGFLALAIVLANTNTGGLS